VTTPTRPTDPTLMALRTKYGYIAEGQRSAHTLLVEQVLGHALPKGAVVHHIDGNGSNNDHSNLVVCPSQAYHLLLHMRQRALEECGNANWRKCKHCKQYDAPENLKINEFPANHGSTVYHAACHADYCRPFIRANYNRKKAAPCV